METWRGKTDVFYGLKAGEEITLELGDGYGTRMRIYHLTEEDREESYHPDIRYTVETSEQIVGKKERRTTSNSLVTNQADYVTSTYTVTTHHMEKLVTEEALPIIGWKLREEM